MDERLEKALEQANYSIAIQTQKKNLRLAYENALVFAFNGGSFTADERLNAFLNSMLRVERGEVIVLDDRQNPIQILDLFAFANLAADTYQAAANAYYVGYEKLRRARTTKAAMGV